MVMLYTHQKFQKKIDFISLNGRPQGEGNSRFQCLLPYDAVGVIRNGSIKAFETVSVTEEDGLPLSTLILCQLL